MNHPALSFQCQLENDWTDYNGHLRDAYYGLIFSYAVDSFMTHIGIDENYRTATGGTLYVLEDHRFYLKEVRQGSGIRVKNRVLGHDWKRIHLLQEMFVPGDPEPVSRCESMQVHVVQDPEPSVQHFPVDIHNSLSQIIDPGAGCSRSIAIRSRSARN